MRFLLVDRITAMTPRESISGVKYVTMDDAWLCSDVSGRLCFIPSLMGEALGQLAAWNAMSSYDFTLRPVAGIVASATLHRNAYVGETLTLHSTIERLDETSVQYNSQAYVGNALAFEVVGALGPMLPMAQFIDTSIVKQQFDEIYRLGALPAMIDTPLETVVSENMMPRSSMQFDRILSMEPGVRLHAQKCVSFAAGYFPDHFPKKPVLPMTVLLECKLNLARRFIASIEDGHTLRVSTLRRIKMNDFIQPGDIVDCYMTVKSRTAHELVLSFRSEVLGKRVCVLELVMLTSLSS